MEGDPGPIFTRLIHSRFERRTSGPVQGFHVGSLQKGPPLLFSPQRWRRASLGSSAATTAANSRNNRVTKNILGFQNSPAVTIIVNYGRFHASGSTKAPPGWRQVSFKAIRLDKKEKTDSCAAPPRLTYWSC